MFENATIEIAIAEDGFTIITATYPDGAVVSFVRKADQ